MSPSQDSLRRIARDSVARLLWACGATRPRVALAGRLTIVTLHRVLPDPMRSRYPLAHLAITPRLFEELLDRFAREFECRPVSEALEDLSANRATGRPLLAITFDDGMRDNFEWAAPILRRHGVRATFYVVAEHARSGRLLWHDRLAYSAERLRAACRTADEMRDSLRNCVSGPVVSAAIARFAASDFAHAVVQQAKSLPDEERELLIRGFGAAGDGDPLPDWEGMMDFTQIRALAADGHEIGSHSSTHAILLGSNRPDLEREIDGSRRVLESECGGRVRSFCYPNGDFDAATVARVRAAGYASAVTTRHGSNALGEDPWRLRRCEIVASRSQRRDGSLAIERVALRLSPWFARGV